MGRRACARRARIRRLSRAGEAFRVTLEPPYEEEHGLVAAQALSVGFKLALPLTPSGRDPVFILENQSAGGLRITRIDVSTGDAAYRFDRAVLTGATVGGAGLTGPRALSFATRRPLSRAGWRRSPRWGRSRTETGRGRRRPARS